jgi:hypothetical protein
LLPTLEPSVLCEGSVGIGKVSDGFRVGARFQRARGHLARRVPITLGAVEVFLRDGMKSDPPEPGEPSSSAASGPRRTARPPTGGVRGNRITSAHTPRFAGSVSSARRGELHFVEERATAGGRDADPTPLSSGTALPWSDGTGARRQPARRPVFVPAASRSKTRGSRHRVCWPVRPPLRGGTGCEALFPPSLVQPTVPSSEPVTSAKRARCAGRNRGGHGASEGEPRQHHI